MDLLQVNYLKLTLFNSRQVLKEVGKSGSTHFVLDCSIESLGTILQQAQQVGLMTDKYHYIITNLDMHTIDLIPYQYGETNITGVSKQRHMIK